MTPVEGAYYSGKLGLLINDGYNQMEANADVHLLTADVDTDSFYISPAAAINIMTMDDAQYNTAMSELEAIFNQLGTMIMETYPAQSDLFAIRKLSDGSSSDIPADVLTKLDENSWYREED